MDKPHILLVERRRSAHKSFVEALKKRYTVSSVNSGKQALATAKTTQPVAVIVDAISLNSPGDRIVRAIKDGQSAPVLHLVPEAAQSDADIVLEAPISLRKLNSALERLRTPAGTGQDALVVGPFRLDVARRVLVVDGKESQLTPKLALLVEAFMRQPGQTIDRRQLMEQVWQTDYMGDTRTLDVHIRWIRSVIEADPAHPLYLKTVRGIGYRLELATEAAPAASTRSRGRASSK